MKIKGIFSGIITIMFLLFLSSCAKPPVNDIVNAQSALKAARDSGAREFASSDYQSAEEILDQAIEMMNKKNYGKARELALKASLLADKARARAKKEKRLMAAKVKKGEERVSEASPEEVARLQPRTLAEDGRLLTTNNLMIPDEALILKRAYFDFDKYYLREDAKITLEINSQWLLKNPDIKFQLEGHCDERGTNEYNLALGEKRASAVRDYLVALGVSGDRISTISFGEEVPLDSRHNREAWAKNRRVQFVILLED